MGQCPVKEAFLQVHGKLTSAGTIRQCDAALLSGEEAGRPARLYLARTDKDEMAPVTIREVLPSIGGGDTRIRLSTGDIFTISGTADLSAVERYFPRQGRLGARLSRMELVGWRGMVLLSLIFMSLLIGFRFAIAPVGDLLAKAAPPSLVARGSGLVLAQLDMTVLEESALPNQQRQKLRMEFERMRRLAPPDFADTRLHFRKAPLIGPNAFALPGNDVVLLDELVTFANDEDVVLAVLAHEFGHVIERHALRHIMRSAVVAMGVSLLVGAEESILEEIVGFGSGLVLSGQSREFELAADHVSADWMRQLGHDTDALARFFQRLADDCGPLCDGGGLMASHPSFADRIGALEHQSD